MLARALLTATAALIGLGSAAAAEPCEDNRTTREAIDCLSAAAAQARVELDALRGRVRQIVSRDPEVGRAFEGSEAAWSAYRKRVCEEVVFAFWRGGTIRTPATYGCELRLTRSHIADLEDLFHVPLTQGAGG